MIKMHNDHLNEAVNQLSQINIPDCTGGCNEIKAAAQAYLDTSYTGSGIPEAETRLHTAAKTALVKDDACNCHRRDDLLYTVVSHCK